MSTPTLFQLLEDLPPLVTGTGTWDDMTYLVAAVVLAGLSQYDAVGQVYDVVEKHVSDDEARFKVVQRIKDAIFKSIAIVGTPRALNSLVKFRARLPDAIVQEMPKTSIRPEFSNEAIRDRGQQLFDTIYERHAKRVQSALDTAYPDLWTHTIVNSYGYMLSDTTYVTAMETSFIVLAALSCDHCDLEIKGHFHGAMHNGATLDQLRTLQEIVKTIAAFFDRSVSPLPFRKR
ncbi:hypothetical protein BC940DRAFT_250644 [Gongronella butleri]|nr:hypothetical protein BC940DRAFT_250644 [Gongronella butleri]